MLSNKTIRYINKYTVLRNVHEKHKKTQELYNLFPKEEVSKTESRHYQRNVEIKPVYMA